MKILLLSILSMVVCSTSKAREIDRAWTDKEDTLPTVQLIDYLQQIDVKYYYGKPVDSFLLNIPANPINLKIYGGSNSYGAMYRANYLLYNYSGGIYIRIYVTEYTHMNRYSATLTWDLNLFKLEKIDRIDIYRDEWTCLNGACLQ